MYIYIYVSICFNVTFYIHIWPPGGGLAQAQVAPGHRCCGNWTPWSTTLWSPPSATATRPWRPWGAARPGAGHWASWNGPWRNIWRPVSSPAVCCWISWDRNLAWPWRSSFVVAMWVFQCVPPLGWVLRWQPRTWTLAVQVFGDLERQGLQHDTVSVNSVLQAASQERR